MYKIEKGIPIPEGCGRWGNAKYPWERMEVGDSFFVPGRAAADMSGARQNAAKRFGRAYGTKNETKDGVRGVRVWRVS